MVEFFGIIVMILGTLFCIGLTIAIWMFIYQVILGNW